MNEKIISEINAFCNGKCGGAVRPVRRQQLAEQNRRENMTEGERQLEDEANLQQFDKLYDALLDESGFDANDLNRNLLKKKLNVKPIKDRWMQFTDATLWQADTKVFGQDVFGDDIQNNTVVASLLVCVDASTRRCDAEPMRDITQQNALASIRKILDRHIIQNGFPKIVYTDQGGEFGRVFTHQLNQWGIKHRQSYAGRKSQTSIVEHTIALLSFGLMANLYKLRVQGRQPSQQPRGILEVNFLADNILQRLVNKINKWASQHYPSPAQEWFNFDYNVPQTDLKEGDWVLVPKIKTERIKQRSGQHSFLNTPYRIIKVYRPTLKNEPYRFLTSISLNQEGNIDRRKLVTFKRDELVKVEDYQINNPVLEFD
jgi:hypothetical protein